MKITPANGHRGTGQDPQAIAVAAPTLIHGQIATIAFFFVALFLMVFWAGKSFGQANGKYDVDQLNPKLKEPAAVKALESARRQMASRRNADTSSREWKIFKVYYTDYIFKRMTLPEARGELSEIVNDVILKDLARAQRANATAAPAILQWSIKEANDVASGNYHPAARINAAILLANLDEKPADNSSGTPPTPSTATFAPLKKLWDDQNNPDGVRAAALQGLRRHVTYGFRGMKADDKKSLQTSMFQLLAAEPPAGRNPAAHGFLQRYAVDILYVLNDESSAQTLTNALIKLSSDPATDPVISLYAAQKLARIGKEIKPIAEPAAVATAWSSKAADFFGNESERLVNMKRPEPVPDQPRLVDPNPAPSRMAGSGGGYGAEMMGGYGSEMMGGYGSEMMDGGPESMGSDTMSGYGSDMMGGYGSDMMGGYGGMGASAAKPQPIEVIAARRKLNHALQSLNYGLTGSTTLEPAKNPAGVVQATAEADRAALLQLVEAIATAVEHVNDPQYDTREKFAEMVAEEAAALRKLSRRLGGAAAQPGPGEAPGEAASPDVAFATP